ncbi:hypothetical protein SKAU_G00021390 [Synaphobranchus kaupii]|uniref:Uncharacterized protein n=1 Tax=Synaphobranchus kaupii TaxID=118154 RepID=A0A9Q1GBV6_SYNKA|nr:hypothetical protein SKAU_G00021390 [Synaphobranchus kaupii]
MVNLFFLKKLEILTSNYRKVKRTFSHGRDACEGLQAIKVNEFKTQLQALHELMEVYDKACNLGNEKNKRRRRRQVHQRRMTQLL